MKKSTSKGNKGSKGNKSARESAKAATIERKNKRANKYRFCYQ